MTTLLAIILSLTAPGVTHHLRPEHCGPVTCHQVRVSHYGDTTVRQVRTRPVEQRTCSTIRCQLPPWSRWHVVAVLAP